MKDNNVKEMLCGAGRKICRKTESAAHAAKLAVEIEAQKMRLSTIYERIGEAVVSGVLSEEGGEEKIFRFVDEAKLEKEKLASLYGAKQKIFAKASCGKCGREGKKGSFCHSCGEYLK